ncbi:hypothetical protein [Aquirufa sp. A-Brett2-W8]
MNDLIRNILIAFLGGSFALVLQLFSYRKERLGNRRSILYILIEVYGNITRLERLKDSDHFLDKIFSKLDIDPSETDQVKPFLNGILFKVMFEDVINELNELSDNYSSLILSLASEKPILAYKISHLAKSLEKSTLYFDGISNDFKTQFPESEHEQIDSFIKNIFHNNIIFSEKESIRKSILKVGRSISIFQYFKAKNIIKEINTNQIDETEIEKFATIIKQEIEKQLSTMNLIDSQ